MPGLDSRIHRRSVVEEDEPLGRLVTRVGCAHDCQGRRVHSRLPHDTVDPYHHGVIPQSALHSRTLAKGIGWLTDHHPRALTAAIGEPGVDLRMRAWCACTCACMHACMRACGQGLTLMSAQCACNCPSAFSAFQSRRVSRFPSPCRPLCSSPCSSPTRHSFGNSTRSR